MYHWGCYGGCDNLCWNRHGVLISPKSIHNPSWYFQAPPPHSHTILMPSSPTNSGKEMGDSKYIGCLGSMHTITQTVHGGHGVPMSSYYGPLDTICAAISCFFDNTIV